MFLNMNLQDTKGDNMSDYSEGWQDGVKFAREVIANNIRKWAESGNHDGDTLDWVADQIEYGTVDYDL
jgi:hypothetical protein